MHADDLHGHALPAGDTVKQLTNRVAVITGAGSGIGRATSLALAQRGCDIVAVDIDAAAALGTAQLVQRAGRTATAHVVDLRDREAVARLAANVDAEHGGCHILINCAGVTSAGTFDDESDEDLRWIIDTNVWGTVHTTRAFLPMLRAADEAHIVNLSSMVGLLGFPYNTSYALTKGAVRSFSEALRAELIATGIGVTVVFPGTFRTNITESARGTHATTLQQMGRHRVAGWVMQHPDKAARRIIRGIERNRGRVVVGPDARAVDLFTRLIPGRSGWVGRLAARAVRER